MRLKQKYRHVAADVPAASAGTVAADPPGAAVPDPATAVLKEQIDAPPANLAAPTDPLENIPLPPLAKQWLRANPEYLYEPDKNQRLQALHWELVAEGLEEYSQPYFEEASRRLSKPQAAPSPYTLPASARRAPVSAPPSREGTVAASYLGGTEYDLTRGRVNLTRDEKEAARISGISEADYAANKLRLLREKSAGFYGGQP